MNKLTRSENPVGKCKRAICRQLSCSTLQLLSHQSCANALFARMVWPDTVVFADASLTIIVYIGLGIVAFGQLEHWNFQDTLYFLMTSCTTIGYGDMVPRTDAAKVFTAIYVPLGFIPVFRFALPYGRAICQCVQGLSDKVIPRSYRRGPAKVSEIQLDDSDLSAYLSAILGPLAVIALGTGLAWHFLYFSGADALYFASTTLATVGYGDLTPTDLPRELATGFYGVLAAGTFFACVEACYKISSNRQVKSIDLHKFADELLLQESPWDSTWVDSAPPSVKHESGDGAATADKSARVGNDSGDSGSDGTTPRYVFARKADDEEGLSEAEFIIAVLTGHGIVDVPTLVSIRKQFRSLMQTAQKAGVHVGSDGAAEPRLDAKAVFAIMLSEGKVRQRGTGQAQGEMFEVSVQEGQVASHTPGALVDLTADDGGYREWKDFAWAPRCKELRDKANEAQGGGRETARANVELV